MLFPRFSAILALNVHAFSAANALSITDRFVVDLDSSDYGGCKWVGEDILNNMINECVDLAQAGLTAIKDYSNTDRPEAKRLLESFFKKPVKIGKDKKPKGDMTLSSAELDEIKKKFQGVYDWLKNGGDVDDGRSPEPPSLFCHHTWLEQGAMSDAAKDLVGHDIEVERPDGTKRPQRIEEIDHYIQEKAEEEEILRKKGVKNPDVRPYWGPGTKFYIFDQYREGKNAGFCSDTKRRGVTVQYRYPSTLTLCPAAFGTNNDDLSNSHVVKLSPDKLKPKLKSQLEKGSQQIRDVVPSSDTMFHELFHLVLGGEVTFPRKGEVYSTKKILEADFKVSKVNPETYSQAAVAYYLTLKSKKKQGWRIEFYTGYTTQG